MENHIPVSVCIITKNECDKLKDCLTCLKPYTDAGNHEIVIIDTGSTDNTVEMCKSFTEKMYYFEWINDFSAARNFAASKAANDWIVCIDSDENISVWDEEDLQDFISHAKYKAGFITQSNLCGFGQDQYISNDAAPRIYNRKEYHYTQPIHEQLTPLDPAIDFSYKDIRIVVKHMSYFGTIQELKVKSERNIALLKKELEKDPHDTYILYQIGQSYYIIDDFDSAKYYYELALAEDVNPRLDYVSKMVISYGYTLINLKEYQKALELEGVYETFGNLADFVFMMGLVYMNNGFLDNAVSQFEKATTFQKCNVEGANSFRAYYNLGVIYECAGYIEKAMEYYTKCENFTPALNRLKEITSPK